MRNVVGYLRVSTDEQVLGYSLDSQENNIKDYCIKNGLNLLKIYRDEGISGKSITNRPGIKKMLQDTLGKSNDINGIVVWKLNRLSRKNLDILIIIEELTSHNIPLISINEGIDSLSPSGKIMVHMMGIVSEIERDNISANVKAGMQQRANTGEWNGNAVYGYDITNKRLVINEEEAKIIKLIYNMYVYQNKGYKAIVQHLNSNDIRTKKNNLWSVCTVRDKLKNPVYAGYISWGKYQNYASQRRRNPKSDVPLVKGNHKPIISKNLWHKAQEKINSPKESLRLYDNKFLLSGVIKCPMCEGSMVAYHRKNYKTGTSYRYYQCYNANRKGTTACKHNLIDANYAEEYVINELEYVFSNPTIIKNIIATIKNIKSSSECTASAIKQIDQRLSLLEDKLSRARELLINNVFTIDEYNSDRNKYIEQKELLLKDRAELMENISVKPKKIHNHSEESIINALNNYKVLLKMCSPEKARFLIKTLIERVTTKIDEENGKRIVDSIKLKFPLPG